MQNQFLKDPTTANEAGGKLMNKVKVLWLLVAALLLVVSVTAVVAEDNPVVYDNWQSGDAASECATIGTYEFGYKVDAAAPNGSWTLEDNTITILNSDGKVFDWQATDSIGAVIVKAGEGANVWVYDPAAASDTGLYGYQDKEISHVTFCWNGSQDYEELTVSKTAATSYIRKHYWDIDKKVETEMGYMHDGLPKIWLFTDGSGDETATWTVDVTYLGYRDYGFNVSGSILIENTGTLDAVISDVNDELAGTRINVACGVTFPHTLPVGQALTCTYNEDGYVEGANEVTVTTERDSYFAAADIIWGEPTSEDNKSVTIVDYSELFGEQTLGTVTAPHNFTKTYTQHFAWADFGANGCGDYVKDNTAKILETGKTASAKLKVNVQCYIYETAYAKGDSAGCFIDYGFNNWGWTNPVGPGAYEWPLWAAAGQCDTSKGMLVGTVMVVYGDDGYVTVTYNVAAPYLLDETHVYAGYDMFPQNRKGKDTVAPGQYTNHSPFNGSNVYVIAHAVVGIPDPDFGP